MTDKKIRNDEMQRQPPANRLAKLASAKLTSVAGPRGGGVGAGTRCAALGKDTSGPAVEAGFTLLTVTSLSVALTVQTHTCTTAAERDDSSSRARSKLHFQKWMYYNIQHIFSIVQ